ncbi:hypothetical protein HY643_01100 [Candidatus Woesearchaeota archaeon]|nr:hypothetical protein [Candidatus Woesearchaeota archaeon]
MSLKDVFEQAEKPAEEKKLEVILSEELVIKELLVYIEKVTPAKTKDTKNEFATFLTYLQSYKITPSLVTKLNKKADTKKLSYKRKDSFGLFLSAMVQTSYEQGFNDFELGEVNANLFGAYLEGHKSNTIRLKVNNIFGDSTFMNAKECSLTAKKVEGNASFKDVAYCYFNLRSVKGDYNFQNAQDCIIEIREMITLSYSSIGEMKQCEVYSTKDDTLYTMKQSNNNYRRDNSFYLVEPPNTLLTKIRKFFDGI